MRSSLQVWWAKVKSLSPSLHVPKMVNGSALSQGCALLFFGLFSKLETELEVVKL